MPKSILLALPSVPTSGLVLLETLVLHLAENQVDADAEASPSKMTSLESSFINLLT